MTRFARAKGSKSSNERKPEEATSWSEMRKSLLSRKTVKSVNSLPERIAKPDEGQECSEWASLGDDGCSESLLKQHSNKKNKKGNKTETLDKKIKVKKKKKKTAADEIVGVSVNAESEQEIKEKKTISLERSEGNVKNKKKKRKKLEDDSEEVSPKKKKKMEAANNESVEKKKVIVGEGKKVKKSKTETKSKSFKIRKGTTENSNHDGKKQFQGNFIQKSRGKNKFKGKTFEKGSPAVEELIINGEKIEIIKFQGFYVTVEDAERLKKLRNEMKKEGIPRDKMEAAIKLERRRAEKALSRLKKSVCFHCRGHGHLLSNCPNLTEKDSTGTGICYKCGSTEHSAVECKVVRGSNYQFAECFICKEQGHIARQCPDNPRGLYPLGGACRECGDVTHLRKDCPNVLSQKEEETVTVALRQDRNLECLDEEIANREKSHKSGKTVKKNSTVKF